MGIFGDIWGFWPYLAYSDIGLYTHMVKSATLAEWNKLMYVHTIVCIRIITLQGRVISVNTQCIQSDTILDHNNWCSSSNDLKTVVSSLLLTYMCIDLQFVCPKTSLDLKQENNMYNSWHLCLGGNSTIGGFYPVNSSYGRISPLIPSYKY